MKRRKVLQYMVVGAAGVTLWPACKVAETKSFDGLDLSTDQIDLLDQFVTAILPADGLPIETPESRLDFVVTMLRDCTSPDERRQFENGVKEFQEYTRNNFQKPFGNLSQTDQETAFIHLHEEEGISENLKTFYSRSRAWSIQHFTTSSYFLNTYTDFQFVPGHFYGCVAI